MSTEFPVDRLHPLLGTISGSENDITIEIPLKEFELEDEAIKDSIIWEGIVETSIILEYIQLPSREPSDLSGKSFEFPISPEPGYIDGSIFIDETHHRVDVTRISFNQASDGQLQAEFKLVFRLGVMDYRDTPHILKAQLQSTAYSV